VRPFVVVIILPAVQDLLGVLEREKVVLRKALSPERAVECLVHRVVRRFPASAEVEWNQTVSSRFPQVARSEDRGEGPLRYGRSLTVIEMVGVVRDLLDGSTLPVLRINNNELKACSSLRDSALHVAA